jgi:hypothetical protein
MSIKALRSVSRTTGSSHLARPSSARYSTWRSYSAAQPRKHFLHAPVLLAESGILEGLNDCSVGGLQSFTQVLDRAAYPPNFPVAASR